MDLRAALIRQDQGAVHLCPETRILRVSKTLNDCIKTIYKVQHYPIQVQINAGINGNLPKITRQVTPSLAGFAFLAF